jgi:hypothetical protein
MRVSPRFDGVITLGNLLTMISMIATLLGVFWQLDRRVTVLEQLAKEYVPRIREMERSHR